MMWLGLLVLLAIVIPLQIAVLGGMLPRRIVARAQVRVPGRAVEVRSAAESAAAEAASSGLTGSTKPEITYQAVDVDSGTRVIFSVAGEVPGRFARIAAHFVWFPRLANDCASRLQARRSG